MPKLWPLPLGPTPSPSNRIRNALSLWVMWVVSFMSVSFVSGLPGVGHVGHVGHAFLVAGRVCVGHLWVICDDPQETRMGIGFAAFVGHFLEKTKSLAPSV